MRYTRSKRWTLLRLPITILVLTLLTFVPAFGAIAQDATPAARPGEGLFFTFANATASGPLFVGMQEGVQRSADAAGVELKLYNNNFDGETALRNAQLMVQDQPDFIIMYNAVEGVGARIGKTFNDAGIPCIAVNVPFPGCAWFNLSNKDIGTETGKVAAEAAKAKGWTGEDTTVVLVQNATAGEEVNHSVMYFYEAVAQNMPGMDQIAATDITRQTTTMGDNLIQVDGQSALEPSYTAVKNVLPTIPEGRHILIQTPNDDSAMGAWRAIVEANRVDDALITGLGGGEEGLKQLRENPNWVAEGDIFFPFWGQYLVAMALEMLKGDVPPERTAAPQVVLTKETIDQYYPEGATTPEVLPPLTAENEYLADSELLKMLDNIEGIND
ncbi:MAG: periplasmic binding protein/LacI transcriptional regulator [Thermomicrobiales bacterium]|nr:periplasmic binding protein/LacI transcriptional regulator [Thermomicrobiales bacterium]